MMTLNPINHGQAKALAALVHQLRPDWDEPGIVSAVGAARDRADPVELCVAALRAAGDQTNRTPAVIGMDGRHWRAGDPTPRTPNTGSAKCPRCHWFHGPNGPCEPVRPADPAVVAEALRQARERLPASKDNRVAR